MKASKLTLSLWLRERPEENWLHMLMLKARGRTMRHIATGICIPLAYWCTTEQRVRRPTVKHYWPYRSDMWIWETNRELEALRQHVEQLYWKLAEECTTDQVLIRALKNSIGPDAWSLSGVNSILITR